MRIIFLFVLASSYQMKKYSESIIEQSAEPSAIISFEFAEKPDFIQLSKDDSSTDNRDLNEDGYIIGLLVFNFIGCAVCYFSFKFVNDSSRELSLKISELRQKYEEYKSLKNFKPDQEDPLLI